MKLKDTYTIRELKFVEDDDRINLDTACHNNLSIQSYEAWNFYQTKFGICSGRNSSSKKDDLENLIEETRQLILKFLKLPDSEWQVVFTMNATDSLNLATNIMSYYLEDQEYNYGWCGGINIASHKSLSAPLRKACTFYKTQWVKLKSDLVFPDSKIYSHKLVATPFVDNTFGYNHWGYFCSNLENTKLYGYQPKNTHIILDACQSGILLFNPSKTYPVFLKPAGAIAFSTHKINAPSGGVLVIRKKYFKNIDIFEIPGIRVGGGNTYLKNGSFYVNKDNNPFEAGLKNDASIIAFGAYLDYLYSIYENRETNRVPFQRSDDHTLELLDIAGKIKSCIARVANPEIEIVRTLPQFSYLNSSKYGYNNVTFRNYSFAYTTIIPLKVNGFTNDIVSGLLDINGIEVRVGKFCMDYLFEEYNMEEVIRLSIDYSMLQDTDKKLQKIEEVFSNIAGKLRDLKFGIQTNNEG